MKKVIVYFSEHCKDCGPLKAALDEAGIKYAPVDISSGMFPLKQFLKYRDYRPEFDAVKAGGRVGVPCIVVKEDNGEEKILFELPENLDELR
jgi:glutaredoxin-related protein